MGGRRRKNRPEPRNLSSRISTASLLLVGLALGLSLGLYYAWVVDPVIFVDARPARLNASYKEEYIYLVSQSYSVTGNWPQAMERLEALDDPNLPQTLNALLEQYLRTQRPPQVVENLAALARQAGAEGAVVALFAPTPVNGAAPDILPTATPTALLNPTTVPLPTNTPTRTPAPTITPVPTLVPSPTVRPDYRLLNQERLCSTASTPRIEVITYDALLNELPGAEVVVRWDAGEDSFFTGFKPENGPGYGDFTMEAGVSYSVQLAAGSPEVSGLRIEPCTGGVDGGWRLSFQNMRLVLETEEDEENGE